MDTRRREPYLFSEDVRARLRTALRLRYAHLPLWYTLFYEHERTGEPVIRPLFYEFPQDVETYDVDYELLVGGSVLARPISEAGVATANVYFPGDGGEVWYDFQDFRQYQGSTEVNVPVTLDKVRGDIEGCLFRFYLSVVFPDFGFL